MKFKKWQFSFVALILIAVIWRVFFGPQREVLEQSDQFILYSLRPRGDLMGKTPQGEWFHGNYVLGEIVISDAQTKAELTSALYRGIAESNGAAACFQPRHGIRAVHGRRTVDTLICFECGRVDFWENGKYHEELISGSPRSVFDAALQRRHIPLSKSPFQR